MDKMKVDIRYSVLLILFILSLNAFSQKNEKKTIQDLLQLTFDDFLKVEVSVATKYDITQAEAPAIISVITAKEIEMFASRDLSDILDRAVGSFIYGSFYLPNNMIALRGEVTSHYCTHVLVLINGRPLRSSKEGYLLPVLRSFPTENIKQIEILKGPGSALYGSGAYAGVVNIITKKGSRQETTASIRYGSFGTGIAQIATGYETKDFNISAAGYFMNSQGWDYKVRGATSDKLYHETNTPAIESSKGLSLISNYKDVTLTVFAGTNYQMIGQNSQAWWYADEWYLGTTNILADLGYKHQFGDNFTTTINGTYNFLKYWQPYDVHANDVREWGNFNDFLVEINNLYQPSHKLSVTLGALANLHTGHILNTETLSDGTPYDVWAQPKNPDPFYVVPGYSEIWWSFYSNINYKPYDFLSLTAGFHANKVTNLPLDVVPRLGAVFSLKVPVTLKVLYGQAFRSPDVFELYSNVNGIYGNEYLKPEKITTYETQLLFTPKNGKIALSFFSSSQENVIGRSLARDSLLIVNGIPQPMYINSEGLKSRGFEFESEFDISSEMRILFSTLYHVNEDQEGNNDIYGLPNLFFKLGFQYAMENGINIGLSNMWVSNGNEFDVPYPNANPSADSFNYLTLKASTNITQLFKLLNVPDILVDITGFNLLNEGVYYSEYNSKIINTIPGRSGIALYGGLKIKF